MKYGDVGFKRQNIQTEKKQKEREGLSKWIKINQTRRGWKFLRVWSPGGGKPKSSIFPFGK